MRLFVALDLPWDLRERLALLAGGLPGARWVVPENLHLTLRFIGEVNGPQAEEIDHALAGLRARGFPLRLAGLGVYHKNDRPVTLWIGAERSAPLAHLQTKIETALQRAGLEPERRRFTPHVTLARLDASVAEAKLGAYIQAHNLFQAEAVQIGHFALFSSLRGKEQSVYTSEVEYALA
jgi:2'-5' RNA ligase